MRYLSIGIVKKSYNKSKGGEVMRLKDLREDNDIKQRDIAEYLHIKQNTYSQYENGQRQLPIDVLISLAKYYNVSTDYILGLSEHSTTNTKLKSVLDSSLVIGSSVSRI